MDGVRIWYCVGTFGPCWFWCQEIVQCDGYTSVASRALLVIDFISHILCVWPVFENIPDFCFKTTEHMCGRVLVNFHTVLLANKYFHCVIVT